MTRFLPIVLLAFGLVLAFSALAAAKAPPPYGAQAGAICMEEEPTPPSAETRQTEQTAMRCWKKLRTGLPVSACGPDPVLGLAFCLPAPERPALVASAVTPYSGRTSVPELHLPPPRA